MVDHFLKRLFVFYFVDFIRTFSNFSRKILNIYHESLLCCRYFVELNSIFPLPPSHAANRFNKQLLSRHEICFSYQASDKIRKHRAFSMAW